MDTKQIVFTKKCVAELLDREIPEPAAGQVTVRTEYTAVSSGTERASLLGTAALNVPKFPCCLGYCGAGHVARVGEGVTDLKVGDRVAVRWGFHSGYINCERRNVLKLESGIDMRAAALFFIATFPLAAIRKCRVEAGESVMVMGQGVLGQIAVMLLRCAGAVPVIAADPVAEKRERAIALGADCAFDPLAADFAEKVRALTGGVDAAIEVTGVGAGLNETLDCMRKLGRVALLGCTRSSDFTVDYYKKVHCPGITLIGAHTNARPQAESYSGYWTESDDMRAIMRLSSGGRIDLSRLVEEIRSPEEAPEVYKRLTESSHFPVTLFDWKKL